MNHSSQPCITSQGDCRSLKAFGDEVLIHLSGADTSGQFCLFTSITPPGGGPPPHYHENEDEWFMPIEGELEIFTDGNWIRVEIGTAIFMPRGTIHSFRNVGTTTSKLLTQTSPSGFEDFFSRCEQEFAKPNGPEMKRIVEIAAEHGIHFVHQSDS